MQFVPTTEIIDKGNASKPTYMKFEITGTGHDADGKYHGTVHKEGDGSCHVIASNKSRSIKSKMVRKGFWNGIPYYEDKGGQYANEVNFAYHNFCENDLYNPKQAFTWDDDMGGGRSKRRIHKKKTKRKRSSRR
jgi:hypothetical protein